MRVLPEMVTVPLPALPMPPPRARSGPCCS